MRSYMLKKVLYGQPQPNAFLRNQEAACECMDVLSVNVWMYTIHFVYAFFGFILFILKINFYNLKEHVFQFYRSLNTCPIDVYICEKLMLFLM